MYGINYQLVLSCLMYWPTLQWSQTDCVHASSVNVFKNSIDKYLVMVGYT